MDIDRLVEDEVPMHLPLVTAAEQSRIDQAELLRDWGVGDEDDIAEDRNDAAILGRGL